MDAFREYMQDLDCLTIFCAPIATIVLYGILLITKSKSGTTNSKLKYQKCVDDTLDISIPSHSNQLKSTNVSGKQRKTRASNKQQHFQNNSALHTSNNKDHINLSGIDVNNWLQNDAYCYERKLKSSSFEENTNLSRIVQLPSNTTNRDTESENLNSFSSNEDLSLTHLEKTNQSTKQVILRQKKKQKRKQQPKSVHSRNVELLDADGIKENMKPSGKQGRKTKSNNINLRKQCTTAAALKSALNNTKISRTFNHNSSTLESNLSIRSSFSSIELTDPSFSSSESSSLNSSPTASPITSKRHTESLKKRSVIPPLRQFTKLNMNEQELAQQMRRYIIDPNLLKMYGFPVESDHYKDCVEIYKCSPKHLAKEAITRNNYRHHFNLYGTQTLKLINNSDGLHDNHGGQRIYTCSPTDSGHGSGASTPRLTDSDSSEIGEDEFISPIAAFYTPDGVYQIFSEYYNSVQKQCVRCMKMFQVNEMGEYLSFDSCTYHWGKLSNIYGKFDTYSCCQGSAFSEGCSKHPLHVWNGVEVGINGPYRGFAHTQHKMINTERHSKIYAIDCEMSYTGLGLEVTKVTVVNFNGSLVYEHFVLPQAKIVDYNTRFSGVSDKDFYPYSNNFIKTFAQVQEDLLNLIDADTILIGHGLDNDLKALRLVHKTIVDTSVVFNHSTGFPYRRSLKNLTKSFLKRDIQCGDMGHSSFEDSRACLELMMWKIRKDLRHWTYQ